MINNETAGIQERGNKEKEQGEEQGEYSSEEILRFMMNFRHLNFAHFSLSKSEKTLCLRVKG